MDYKTICNNMHTNALDKTLKQLSNSTAAARNELDSYKKDYTKFAAGGVAKIRHGQSDAKGNPKKR